MRTQHPLILTWFFILAFVVVLTAQASAQSPALQAGASPWDSIAVPSSGFPHCVANLEDDALAPGFCFRTTTDAQGYTFGGGAFTSAFFVGFGSAGPNGFEKSARLRVPSSDAVCSARWISIAGSWFLEASQLGAFVSTSCPILITAPPLTFGGVDPAAITVMRNREFSGSPLGGVNLVPEQPSNRLRSQVMLLDSDAVAGAFASGALRVDDSVRGTAVSASELTNVPVTSADVSSVNVAALTIAYGFSDSGHDRSLRFWSLEGFTGYPDVIKFDAQLSSDVLRPRDPDLVESDDLFFWIDQPGGVTNRWEPDEPFDLIRRPVWQPLRLISLGDSYAAGEGATDAELHPCSRSPYGYAGSALQRALAGLSTSNLGPGRLESMRLRSLVDDASDPEQLYRTGNGAEWSYVACTSAQSYNLWTEPATNIPNDPRNGPVGSENVVQYPDSPPDNFTQLANPAVDVVWEPNAVTITMGGNDSGFVPLFEGCLKKSAELIALGFQKEINDPAVLPQSICEFIFYTQIPGINPSQDGTGIGLSPSDFLNQVVRLRLRHTYQQIKQNIPRASSFVDQDLVVTVFGYPKLLQTGCYLGNLLGPYSLAWIESFQNEMNAMIAQEAQLQGFQYVNPVEFEGHRICSDDPYLNDVVLEWTADQNWYEPFINGGVISGGVDDDIGGFLGVTKSLHPNDAGWRAYTEGWERVSGSSFYRAANGVGIYRDFGGGLPANGSSQPGSLQAKSQSQLHSSVAPTIGSSTVVGALSVDTSLPVAGCDGGEVVSNNSIVTATFSGADPGAEIWLRASSLAPTVQALGETSVVSDATGEGTLQLTMPAEGSWQVMVSLREGNLLLGGEIADDVLEVSDGDRPCVVDDVVEPATAGPVGPIDVLGNDTAGDAGWEVASVSVTSEPSFGTASVTNGLITFTPNGGFRHVDSFAYSVCSNEGVCGKGTVTVDYRAGCDLVGDGAATLNGTAASEIICGSPSSELINAAGGADEIYPGGGADVIDVTQNAGGTVFRSSPDDVVIGNNVATVGEGYSMPAAAGGPVAVDDQFTIFGFSGSVNPLLNDLAGQSPLQPESLRVLSKPAEIVITNTEIDGANVVLSIETEVALAGVPLSYEICDVDDRCSIATMRIVTSEMVPSPPAVTGEVGGVDLGAVADDSNDGRDCCISTPEG